MLDPGCWIDVYNYAANIFYAEIAMWTLSSFVGLSACWWGGMYVMLNKILAEAEWVEVREDIIKSTTIKTNQGVRLCSCR